MNIFNSSFCRHQAWQNIKDWFNPKSKWLFKKIGNNWVDVDGLIEIVLFEGLIFFVEEENGFKHVYDASTKDQEAYAELREVYEYVKNTKKLLQKNLDNAYPSPINGGDLFDRRTPGITKTSQGTTLTSYPMQTCEQIYGKSYEEAYKEVHQLEALIEEKDTWAMMTIVKHRRYLWT